MNKVLMRNKCYRCDYYRLISYADGSSSIGCIKQSEDGRPIDIRKLDKCPRGHSRQRCKEIDSQALLSALGRIYTATSVSPAYISLNGVMADYPAIKGKKSIIIAAMRRLGVIEKISQRVEGLSGIRCVYRWNKHVGPPSLDLVDRISFVSTEIAFEMVDRRREVIASGGKVRERSRKPKAKVMPDVTSCTTCRMKAVADCRERLLALGYDCKKINVNALTDEITVGF